MKRRAAAFSCISVILVLVLGFLLWNNRSVFQGERVKEANCYELEFEKMNGKDSHVLTLAKGDSLSVTFEIKGGEADLEITMSGEEPAYKGHDLGTGRFELTIPKYGDYQITVAGRHAEGYIRIEKK